MDWSSLIEHNVAASLAQSAQRMKCERFARAIATENARERASMHFDSEPANKHPIGNENV